MRNHPNRVSPGNCATAYKTSEDGKTPSPTGRVGLSSLTARGPNRSTLLGNVEFLKHLDQIFAVLGRVDVAVHVQNLAVRADQLLESVL